MDTSGASRAIMRSGFDVPGREFVSDQERGLPQPPVEKAIDNQQRIIALPPVDRSVVAHGDLFACLDNRRSRRSYRNAPVTLAELSFLLWATQGVQRIIPAYRKTGHITLRPVPSAGGRHAFETYLAISHVTGLKQGIHAYRPLEHQLVLLDAGTELAAKLIYAYGGEAEFVVYVAAVGKLDLCRKGSGTAGQPTRVAPASAKVDCGYARCLM